jgi:hypothetical protein
MKRAGERLDHADVLVAGQAAPGRLEAAQLVRRVV